jgi:hypothetical protein
MPRLTKHDWQGLWAILWRVLVLCPVLWTFGFAWLVLVLTALVLPPIWAVCTCLNGDWLVGLLVAAVWPMTWRYYRRILAWTFQGIEYASF